MPNVENIGGIICTHDDGGDWKQRMHELAAHLHIPADEAEQIITDAVDEVEQIITDAVASGAPEPEPEPAEVHSKVRAWMKTVMGA